MLSSISELLFLTSDLDAVLPTVEQQAEPDRSPAASGSNEQTLKPKGPIGRPPNASVDEFWIEAARLVKEGKQGSPGQTQQKFIDAMTAWASKNMAELYSPDTVEKKIKRLWKALQLGG